jgi:hypothetical protein
MWKHADRFNRGYPDVTNAWKGITSWWEIKHYDNEPFKSPPQQEITCQRLSQQALCYYVIYEERKGFRNTRIVAPEEIGNWTETLIRTTGFDHAWVADFIRKTHYENSRQKH